MIDYYRHPASLVHPSARIGKKTRIWAFVNIQENVVIGEGCNICDACFIEKGVRIGDHVTVKNGVSVFEGVTLEDDVFCGANVAFINDRYPRSHRQEGWTLEKTLIKKGATLGSQAVILCGVTVGEYAFVAAGSVVTHDVQPFEIVRGNPARPAGYACVCGRPLDPEKQCSHCGSPDLEWIDGRPRLKTGREKESGKR